MNLVYIDYTFNFTSLRRSQKSRKHIHTQPAAYGRAKEGWSISPNDVASITPSFVPCETNSSVTEHITSRRMPRGKTRLDPIAIVPVPPRSRALSLLPSLSLSICARLRVVFAFCSRYCTFSQSSLPSQSVNSFLANYCNFRRYNFGRVSFSNRREKQLRER
jgi:hypothetical protein